MPETEEERRRKAIQFIEECGFTSSECSCCGKTVDSLSLGQLMRCGRCKLAYYCGMKCVERHFEEHRATCLLGQQFGSFLPEADIKSAQEAAASLKRSKPKETKSFSGPIGHSKEKEDAPDLPKKAASFSAARPGPKRSKSVRPKKGTNGGHGGTLDTDATGQNDDKAAKSPKKKKSIREKCSGDAKTSEQNKSTGDDGRDQNEQCSQVTPPNGDANTKAPKSALKRYKSADDLDRDLLNPSKPLLQRNASDGKEPRPKTKRKASKKYPLEKPEDKREKADNRGDDGIAAISDNKQRKELEPKLDASAKKRALKRNKSADDMDRKLTDASAFRSTTPKNDRKLKDDNMKPNRLSTTSSTDGNTEPAAKAKTVEPAETTPAKSLKASSVKRNKSMKLKDPSMSNTNDGPGCEKSAEPANDGDTSKVRKGKLKRYKSADDLEQGMKPRAKPSLRSSKSICEGRPPSPPSSKSKPHWAGGGGGAVKTEEEEIQEAIRKLMDNQGQCCYCEKKVPKHLMLHCARCKLAHYCKMECLDLDFDLHRRICCFVADYKDYAPTCRIDRQEPSILP